jgi:hypothetical protein
LVKLFVVLGLALLAGGTYAIVDGWPYLVLERGFTEVILGAVAATAGLILLALAMVLAEVRRLKGMVSGAMAVMSLAEPRIDTPPAAAAAPQADGPTPAPREAHQAGLVPALAVGAGALAVGGALAGLARIGTGRDDAESAAEAGEAAQAERPAEETGAAAAAAAAEGQPPSPASVEHDDWLAPPDPASLQAPAVAQDEAPEAAAAEAAEASQELGAEPALSGPPAAEAPEAIAEVAGAAGQSAPVAAEDATPEAEDEAQPAEAVSEADELWWPRIDRPSRDETLSDEFSALRAELSGLSREIRPAPEPEASRGEAPDVEAPRQDLDAVGDWMAPRPWPPVTQPRSLDTPADPEPDVPAEAAMAETEEVAPSASEPEPEPASLAEPPETGAADEPAPAADIAPATEEEPAVEAAVPETAAEDERPAASEEGVVGAYQVGETQFTMYADGSIHARTPDGDYVFASMEELKTYLASEKSRLEA